jgi:hypothetical protein
LLAKFAQACPPTEASYVIINDIGATVVVVDVDVVVVVGAAVVDVEVVEVDVVDVVVDVVIPAIFITNVLVHTPVDVTNIILEVSLTLTNFPANNSTLVAVFGVTIPPTFAVRLKLGPKSAPNPESSVIVTFIYF